MKVGLLDSLFAYAFLFWLNMKIGNLTAEAVFGYLERQGAEAECREFKSPPVQVIDDVGKKCD